MAETHDVTAATPLQALGLVSAIAVMAGVVIVSVADGDTSFLVVGLLAAGYAAWEVNRTVWRITLSDGLLELRYLHRRRVVQLAAVERVKFIPRRRRGDGSTPPMFSVRLSDGSSFRIVANDQTRLMMETMFRRQPRITIEGSIW